MFLIQQYFSEPDIRPFPFFKQAVVEVVEVFAAQFFHFVIKDAAVVQNIVVGNFVDKQWVEAVDGQLDASGLYLDEIFVCIVCGIGSA